MDLPAPVEEPGPGVDPEAVDRGTGPQARAEPPVGPEPTLAEVRESLAALSGRVDSLAESFDASVRAAVAEEVQRVAGELQHTVAALGRVLVRDLGRLNQILGQHRDAILAELRGGGRAPAKSAPRSQPGPGAAPVDASAPAEGAGDGDGDGDPDDATEEEANAEKGRHWRRRKA